MRTDIIENTHAYLQKPVNPFFIKFLRNLYKNNEGTQYVFIPYIQDLSK